MATLVVAQDEPTLAPSDDLAAKVADIAALSVRNTDDLASLRNRVAGIEDKLPSLLNRLDQLEAKVFAVPTVPVVVSPTVPVVTYSEPIVTYSAPVLPVVQADPVVRQAPVRQTVRRSRLRPIFRFFLFRRVRRANVTTVSSSRSGSWTWPGDLSSHLSGFHGVSVAGLSQSQMIQIHNQIHNGG